MDFAHGNRDEVAKNKTQARAKFGRKKTGRKRKSRSIKSVIFDRVDNFSIRATK